MQLTVFFTYGIVVFYLVKKYAQQEQYRKIIERSIVFTTLLIIYYGIFQQISRYLGLPITGLTIYDGGTAAFKAAGVSILRFFSLAGEPRQAGTFLIGALFFYLYYTQRMKRSFFTKLNLVLIVAAFFMTFSTSAYLTAAVSLGVIFFDALINQRIRIRVRYLKYGLGILLITLLLFRSGIISIVKERPSRYYEGVVAKLQGQSQYSTVLRAQAMDVVILPYLQQITHLTPLNLLIGYGYGNFLTPIAPLLKKQFNIDIIQEGGFGDTDVYLGKIFIESGIIGVILYGMVFWYTLFLDNKLLRLYRQSRNRNEYIRTLWLRLSFIAFFVANAIHISFFYFIIMGLIIGKLNDVARSTYSNKALDGPAKI